MSEWRVDKQPFAGHRIVGVGFSAGGIGSEALAKALVREHNAAIGAAVARERAACVKLLEEYLREDLGYTAECTVREAIRRIEARAGKEES